VVSVAVKFAGKRDSDYEITWHGFGPEHDRMVGRRGGFRATCLGVEGIQAAGLEVGCNGFVTSTNAAQIPELCQTI